MFVRPAVALNVESVLPMASVKLALKIEADDVSEAALLIAYRAAALDWVERYTAKSLASRSWVATFDRFDDARRLPRGPVSAVTAIGYRGDAGVEVALTSVAWRLAGDGVVAGIGTAWPVPLGGAGAVSVTFTAGFTDVATEAPGLIAAALLVLGHLHRNREQVITGVSVSEVPFGAVLLADQHRTPVFG